MAKRSIHGNRSKESMDELNKFFSSAVQPDIHPNNEALQEIGNTANKRNASSPSIQRQRSLGLKLTITPELCEQVGRQLFRRVGLTGLGGKSDICICESEATGSLMTQDKPDKKYRAASFDIESINIGNWQADTKRKNYLVGKFYYSNKTIVWEVLAGNRKKKLEIKFDYIIAIKAIIQDKEPGILQILLKEAPDFKEEAPPQARKNTKWENCRDFTGGQALIYRTHTVICPTGALDKGYKKLLKSNSRLLKLSQKPFPKDYEPMFSFLRTTSQCNYIGGTHLNPMVVGQQLNDMYGSTYPPPPATGFLPNIGNFINCASNWNHNQQNISLINTPPGQDNPIQGCQVPNYAYGSEVGIDYLNMVRLTSLDNMMTDSEPNGDVFQDEDGSLHLGPTEAHLTSYLPTQVCNETSVRNFSK